MPPKAKAQREVRLERNPRVLLKRNQEFQKTKIILNLGCNSCTWRSS